MKTYEIVTRVVVHDEAALMAAARRQYDLDNGEGADAEDILTPEAALQELSHLGEAHPFVVGGVKAPLDCGVEILKRHIREVDPCPTCTHTTPDERPPSPFPRSVAVEHAGELRQAVADLLEWATRNSWHGGPWRDAKALMTRIRDEEDAAREA